MLKLIKNKRYKDLFEQYIYSGQRTPFTMGTLIVCGICFVLILVTTFTQLNLDLPIIKVSLEGFSLDSKEILYSPQIPIIIFIIYLIGKAYSLITFVSYLLIGFFVYPIFLFGGGVEYVRTYPFGYFLGFIFAAFTVSFILKIKHSTRSRLLAGFIGVLTIHVCAFLYCIVLAIFRALDFSTIPIIVNVVSGSKIVYDIILASLIMLPASYIKNFFWICMKPKADKKKNKTPRNL